MKLCINDSAHDKPEVFISFDFELGWGAIDNGYWMQRENAGVYRRLHSIFPKILEILESAEISVDWATVGALAISPDNLDTGHLPGSYSLLVDKFLKDAKRETKDGRILFEKLAKTRYQNIISHTLTHIVLNREDLADHGKIVELEQAKKILVANGYSGCALVFPENQACDDNVLSIAGVRAVRVSPEYSSNVCVRGFQKIFKPPPAKFSNSLPRKLSGTMLYQPRNKEVINRILFTIQNISIRASVRRGESICLWLHPFNFGIYPSLLKDFEKLIFDLARLRDSNIVTVRNMDNG